MGRVTTICFNCYLRFKGAMNFQAAKYSTNTSKGIITSYVTREFLERKAFKLSKLQSRPYSFPSGEKQPPAQLMDLPIYIWPNLLKTIRNTIFSKFIIKNYFDREFEIDEFVRGSMQAVEVVSSHISNGEWNALHGLVTDEALSQIRLNLRQYTLSQRMDLKISPRDIYFKFPYEIGIILPDRDEDEVEIQNRKLEIVMVYHALKGYEELAKSFSVPINILSVPDYEKNLHVLNYRFYKDFSPLASGHWIINGLNHFKPLAYL